MSKSKSIRLLPLIISGLGVLACLMIFIPGIHFKDTTIYDSSLGSTYLSGLLCVFGGNFDSKISLLDSSYNVVWQLIVAFALPLVAAAWSFFFSKKYRGVQIVNVVIFVVAAILLFLEKNFFVSENPFLNNSYASQLLSISFGPIIAGILCILGALASVVDFILAKPNRR